MRTLPILALLAPLAANAGALLLPVPPLQTVPANALGVNVHAPAQWHPDEPANVAEWAAWAALLSSLPRGTPVRVPLYFHEWAWNKNLDYPFEHITPKIRLLAKYGLPVTFEVTPLPWPGSWGWAPSQSWGAVAIEDFSALDRKFKLFLRTLRAEMAAAGLPERGNRLQIGNEPGSTHPGGNIGLPVGEWYDRVGTLYERMIKDADFGALALVLPALSFQDHDAATAKRERDSAGPILRKLARAKKGGGAIAATHVRLYAPQLGTAEYAEAWLARVAAFRKVAAALSGRAEVAATEVYLFREDRGAVDDRAEILRLVAKRLPSGVLLYRVGPGPTDPTSQLPIETIKGVRDSATALPGLPK